MVGRASRIGERPKPRARMLRLDRGFLIGLGLVFVLAWWIRSDVPPGMPGEPDLRPYRGAPLLIVYAAPWCQDCEAEWRALAPSLPPDLRVLHLVTSTERGYGHPATPAEAAEWAAKLGLPAADVQPADLTEKRLPALVLRDAWGRWRFEHTGRLNEDTRRALAAALANPGLSMPKESSESATPP